MAGNDSYTVLLIHSDHADQSQSFEDSSVGGNGGAGHSISYAGETHHETDQKKFGASSIEFDGDGDHLIIGDHADWSFGTGAFCIDFWVRFDAATSIGFLGAGFTNHWDMWLYGGDTFVFRSNAIMLERSWTPSTGTWYHIAVTRDGNNFRFFVNGTQIGDTYVDADTMSDPDTDLWIGHNIPAGSYELDGFMDEIRISKGVARWTENFTPPTEPYSEEGAGIVFPIFAQEGHHSLVFGGQVIH